MDENNKKIVEVTDEGIIFVDYQLQITSFYSTL